MKPWNMAGMRARTYRARKRASVVGASRPMTEPLLVCRHGHIECAACGYAYDPQCRDVVHVVRRDVTINRELVDFSLYAEPDDLEVRGNVCDCPRRSQECEHLTEIYDRLQRGDVWGWAWVKITARYYDVRHGTLEVHDSIGGCTFADEADFMSAYGEDMETGLLAELSELVTRKDEEDASRDEDDEEDV